MATVPFVDANEVDEGPRLLALDQYPQVADRVAILIDDAPEIVASAGHTIGKQLVELASRNVAPLLNRGTSHIGCFAGVVLEDSLPNMLIFALRHWPKGNHVARMLLFLNWSSFHKPLLHGQHSSQSAAYAANDPRRAESRVQAL